MTTVELLVAKVLGALLPTLAISLAGLGTLPGRIVATAAPGVAAAMLSARTAAARRVWVGPAAALVSLQSAIVISSRVNDPRTAQQFGVLIIIPLTAVLVAQFTGSFWLSSTTACPRWVSASSGVWALLALLSVAIFERETILTRWR